METKIVNIYDVIHDEAKYSFSFSLHEKEYSFDTAPVFFQKNTEIMCKKGSGQPHFTANLGG